MDEKMLIGIKRIMTENSIKLIEVNLKAKEIESCKVALEKKETLGITISI